MITFKLNSTTNAGKGGAVGLVNAEIESSLPKESSRNLAHTEHFAGRNNIAYSHQTGTYYFEDIYNSWLWALDSLHRLKRAVDCCNVG